MQVVSVILVTGDEWIGQVVQTLDENTVTLNRVRKLQVVPTQKGTPGLALMPIVMGAVDADNVVIKKSHIITTIPVDSAFEKQYLAEVSGIQLI